MPDDLNNYIDDLVKKSIAKYTKKQKSKTEFSKKILIAFFAVSVLFTAFSYLLAFVDKNPVEQLSSTIVSVLWTGDVIAFLGYNAQNIGRAIAFKKQKNETDG